MKDERCAFRLKLEKQEKALKFFVDVLPKCKFINRNRVLPCQKALILAGNAVPELFRFVKDKYNKFYVYEQTKPGFNGKHFLVCGVLEIMTIQIVVNLKLESKFCY